MKQITVSKCGECQYLECDDYICKHYCGKINKIIKDTNTIHPDCPLAKTIDYDDAYSYIEECIDNGYSIDGLLEKLGFTEKEGK